MCYTIYKEGAIRSLKNQSIHCYEGEPQMSWNEWNEHYFEKGKEDFDDGKNNPPEDNCLFHPGAFDFDSDPVFTTSDAQSAYDAGRSSAGADAAEESTSSSESSCFLTTACTEAAGLSDDCHELTVLRRFRDTFVRGLDNGEALVQEYYSVSPRIVPRLSKEELEVVYRKVRDIVSDIEHGKFQAAFDAYAGMFTGLREKHLIAS